MSGCRSEGELRAYLDCELPPDQAAAVDAHLVECGRCRAAFGEIGERAGRVAALMSELERGGPSVLPMRRPVRRWALPAAAALAAGLAVALFLGPGGGRRTPGTAVSPGVHAPFQTEDVVAPAAKSSPPTAEPSPSRRRAPRVRPLRPSRKPAPRPVPDYFVALDDEPIEGSAVLMRVALGPAGVPADVVFSPNGRPRAIRLANYQEGEGR
jgi:hypothetical protein